MTELPPETGLPPEVDISRPHSARIYDYYLGGKNHFAADRETADKVLQGWPNVRVAAREQRKFLGRAVRYLAEDVGIRQFLDIATGLPTMDNVHEIAQAVAPESRVVYVDNDLLVLVGILHLIPDEDEPARIIATLVDALPPGSYLVSSQLTAEHDQAALDGGVRMFRGAGLRGQLRDSDEFARLAFAGLDLAPPGVVLVSEWRPDDLGPALKPAEVSCYGAVARKR